MAQTPAAESASAQPSSATESKRMEDLERKIRVLTDEVQNAKAGYN
ncbi:MAG: hypothetical protein R2877_03380 [Bdellovibrionota bacterium]